MWSVLSGKMDEGEDDPYRTVRREINEELGIDPSLIQNIKLLDTHINDQTKFHVFVGYVDDEFDIPNLKLDENDNYGWFNENNLPNPLHKRWGKTFQTIKKSLSLNETIKNIVKNLKK